MNCRLVPLVCAALLAACLRPAGPVHADYQHGVGHHHAGRSFGSPQAYIEHLDRADREDWQRPDALIASLGLQGHETVADLGAGSGYFTFRFARALPNGKVVATDIEQPMVLHLQQRAASEGLGNVQVVAAAPDDPAVPPDADLIFVCDVLHHVARPEVWLARMHAEAKRGARLVVVEFKKGDLPEGPPDEMKLSREEAIRMVTGAGFRHTGDGAIELPYQYVVTFDKP